MKHYLEVTETGELTKTYRQTEEHSETEAAEGPKKRRKLNSQPMTASTFDSDAGDDDEPAAEPEKQDRAVYLGFVRDVQQLPSRTLRS